jgi:YbbR domain-containing protein
VVYVQRENLTKTTVEELPFTLLDADGEAVDTEGLTFSRDAVTVTIPIKMVKEVLLTVKPIYGAGATEDNTTVDVSPKTITISGEADVMEGVNTILLATVDLTEFEFPYAYNFPIPLPNGTANLTGTADAVVTISVLGLESAHLSTPNIQIANVTDSYEATLITQSLDVVIRGKKADIDRLTAENIRVVADLSDLGETTGTYFVTAKVLIDGDFGDVGAIGKYKVTVTLRERPPEPAMAGSP